MSRSRVFLRRDFDKSTRPVDDFYQFVNGGWLKRVVIPPTESRWGSFYTLRKNNRNKLRKLLQKIVKRKNPKGSHVRKLRDFYLSAIDMRRRDKLGITPLQEEIKKIESLKDNKDLIATIAYLHLRGVFGPWHSYVTQDDKNSDKMVFRIHQGGLGMPDRDYYVKNDNDSRRVRNAYKKHIGRIFTLGKRHSQSRVQEAVKTVMDIETKLAHASMTRVELRNIERQYNKKTIKELEQRTPAIDWKEYLHLLGVKNLSTVIIDQPAFLKKVNQLIGSIAITEWRTYFYWHLLNVYADVLSTDFLREDFNFSGKVIMGAKKMRPTWEQALLIVNELMGDTLGELYVREYFPKDAKRRIDALVNHLFSAYRERIEGLDWMSNTTKKRALSKLEGIQRKIGYPSKWIRYESLVVKRDKLVQNCIRAYQFDFKRDIAKLSNPTDRKEWHISPPTVNAFYNPNLNEIVFPAGILQPPFFYPEGDDAVNYGAIGTIIGHELTHGFDDQGSQFDKKGNLKNWWTVGDKKRFRAKSKRLVKQFDRFEVIDGMHVNGKLTLGENIADLGGLVIAYRALEKVLKDVNKTKSNRFTPEERFFISAAIMERAFTRPESLKMQVRNDPHSPARFRTNGPLSNMTEFYSAFGVKDGDGMYRARGERVAIW